ncbi:MAG: hypothetical protein HZC06_12225, partial [Methylocystis sp.]|nr:hypothetical protein [Methylocystis sp.]
MQDQQRPLSAAPRVSFVSLGCPKALVDSERIVTRLRAEGIRNQVSLSALKGLATYLGGLREGRKAIILVSEGYTNNLPPQLNDPVAAMPG